MGFAVNSAKPVKTSSKTAIRFRTVSVNTCASLRLETQSIERECHVRFRHARSRLRMEFNSKHSMHVSTSTDQLIGVSIDQAAANAETLVP